MNKNIKVLSEEKKVILSEQLLEKIKYLLKKDNFCSSIKIDDYELVLNYSVFSDITDYIIKRSEMKLEYMPKQDNEYGIDINKLLKLKSRYLELNPIKEEKSNFYSNNKSWYYYFKKNKIEEFVELIDIIYEMNIEREKYHLTIDLINAKDDCLINMKYFINDEEINKFNTEYEQAIDNKDIQKMQKMLEDIQQLILKEWNSYLGNMESMTDDSFMFIGHSTSQTNFDKEFYSRYVSCSLYTEDINDTYRSGFGFIMGPNNIIGANSSDMYINNYASEEDNLLHYSTIKKIDHPKRLIDECRKQKEANIKEDNRKAVYSEVVKDGFEPIGIFCFTNGTKDFDWNYKRAQQLQKNFPNLEIKVFDIMKRKKGFELDNMKLNLLNSLRTQLTSNNYSIEMENLPRYDIFFKKFDKLKKIGDYTEKDIEVLFKYNLELLSIFNKEPDDLFNGKYTDTEIKYILGKNTTYNIEYILNGQIRAFALNKLKELNKYKDKLNNYYDGLKEFVELISKLEVTDEMIEEMKLVKPLNFYTMSKYLSNKLITILNNKEEQLKYELNKEKNKYIELLKEKEYRQEIKDKYNFYFKISLNKLYLDIIKKDYQELNTKMLQNQIELDDYILEKDKLINEIYNLSINKNDLIISSYENSDEYKSIQSSIEQLRQERNNLSKHPIINIIKTINIDKKINSLEIKKSNNISNYNINKKEDINNFDNKINELKTKLEILEDKIKSNKEINNKLEVEMNNLQNKIKEYFNCDSILEVDKIIEEAEEYLKQYDYSNNFYLASIEKELEKQIFIKESSIDKIQEEKKKIGRI